MFEICQLCKVLSNPLRLELLAHIYQTKDGCNFGYLVDKMQESKLYKPGLCASGVSQYLRELVRLGVVRRHRDGCYTNYHADLSHVSKPIAEITALIIKHIQKNKKCDFAYIFSVLRNPFRANVIRMVAQKPSLTAEAICTRTNHSIINLKRDLLPALKVGIISLDEDDAVPYASYRYNPPQDPVVLCIMKHVIRSQSMTK